MNYSCCPLSRFRNRKHAYDKLVDTNLPLVELLAHAAANSISSQSSTAP